MTDIGKTRVEALEQPLASRADMFSQSLAEDYALICDLRARIETQDAKIKALREAYQSMSAAIGMAKMLIDQGDAAGARRRLDEASEAILALGADDIARASPSTQETKP